MPRILSFRNSFFAIAALLLLSPASAFADSASLANGQSATFTYVAVGFPQQHCHGHFYLQSSCRHDDISVDQYVHR